MPGSETSTPIKGSPDNGAPVDDLTTKPASDAHLNALSLGSKIATTVEQLDVSKLNTSYCPLTPAKVRSIPTTSPAKSSPVKSVGSDWTKKLEKALAEDNKKTDKNPNGAYSVSVPAHLRKFEGLSSSLDPTATSFTSPVAPKASNSNNNLSPLLAKAVVEEEDRMTDEGLAWRLAAGEVGHGGDVGKKDVSITSLPVVTLNELRAAGP